MPRDTKFFFPSTRENNEYLIEKLNLKLFFQKLVKTERELFIIINGFEKKREKKKKINEFLFRAEFLVLFLRAFSTLKLFGK